MLIGATQKTNHQNPRVRFHAGIKRISHQICRLLAEGSLANFTHHRYYCRDHHRHLPYLEEKAR